MLDFHNFANVRFIDFASALPRRQGGTTMLELARELERRTKTFGIEVLRLLPRLPRTPEMTGIRYQLGKASTSVGANYRATCRSRSQAEFLSRLKVVLEEADESVFWLEVITEVEHLTDAMCKEAERLLQEARELRAIFASSVATARRRSRGE